MASKTSGLRGLLIRAWYLKYWKRRSWLLTHPWTTARFLLHNRETTNFTYAISNWDELVDFLHRTTGHARAEAARAVDELRNDEEFRSWVEDRLRTRRDRNGQFLFGRRAGWYAVARLTKPRVVIETGTHDGLGAAVLARALQRNAAEGRPGTLLSFDIDPSTGWLVPDPLRPFVRFVHGDSAVTLPAEFSKLPPPGRVGLFIHDSDHSYEHESRELELVWDRVPQGGVLLSDNAHVCDALKDFCAAKGLGFAYWRDRPTGHPYPGAGIGLALRP